MQQTLKQQKEPLDEDLAPKRINFPGKKKKKG